MPEPDVPPIHLSQDFVDAELATVPLLPADYRTRFRSLLPADILDLLLDYQPLMEKLAECADQKHIKRIANWFSSVLLAEEKSYEMLNDLPSAQQLTDLAIMAENQELSSTGAKEVFLKFFDPQMHTKDAKTIAKELNLLQENDSATLEKIVDEVLRDPATQKAQTDYKNGQEKVLGFLVGQVMKASKGKANPGTAQQILKSKLN